MSVSGATRPFRFSTDDAPVPQRAGAVRAMHERSTLPSKPEPMEPLPGCRIRVDVTQWALPGLGILAGTLCGVRQLTRSERSAPAGADGVFFGITVTGSSIFRQRHDEVVLNGGDGFLAYRGESAFRQEFWLTIIATPLAFWLGRNWLEVALLLGSLLVVLIVELLNSAIEAAIDRISFDLHALSKQAKDLGSCFCIGRNSNVHEICHEDLPYRMSRQDPGWVHPKPH